MDASTNSASDDAEIDSPDEVADLTRDLPECQSANCGGNSPVVNGFPINGLDFTGGRNKEGISFVPKSLLSINKPECSGKTLTVDDQGRLTAGTGCTHDQLRGSSFEVKVVYKHLPVQHHRIKIDNQGQRTFMALLQV